MLKTLFAVVSFFVVVGCSQPYGRQTCKTDKECGTGQVCPPVCATDGGTAGVDTSATCKKACSADSDCGDLGLKKPTCATNLCGGKFCIDSPF